ncbi:hypothetical protein EX30DRAFT_348665 [Ascodesmis nigricans]|uniref:Uncharacterized protein n=1 Tax=Ascodesmis nigricans TaxID=341454 RepID=A0A4S2MXS0_9PEZI|nr:hypothetical protein EX30DRAFT_348665 [Ascodesmis nigricans]
MCLLTTAHNFCGCTIALSEELYSVDVNVKANPHRFSHHVLEERVMEEAEMYQYHAIGAGREKSAAGATESTASSSSSSSSIAASTSTITSTIPAPEVTMVPLPFKPKYPIAATSIVNPIPRPTVAATDTAVPVLNAAPNPPPQQTELDTLAGACTFLARNSNNGSEEGKIMPPQHPHPRPPIPLRPRSSHLPSCSAWSLRDDGMPPDLVGMYLYPYSYLCPAHPISAVRGTK